eukprot:11174054-Lingulodinium_polyedra.AAC.1
MNHPPTSGRTLMERGTLSRRQGESIRGPPGGNGLRAGHKTSAAGHAARAEAVGPLCSAGGLP